MPATKNVSITKKRMHAKLIHLNLRFGCENKARAGRNSSYHYYYYYYSIRSEQKDDKKRKRKLTIRQRGVRTKIIKKR